MISNASLVVNPTNMSQLESLWLQYHPPSYCQFLKLEQASWGAINAGNIPIQPVSKKQLRESMPNRNGGLATVPRPVVEAYCHQKLKEGKKSMEANAPLIRSIQNLRRSIDEDPVLKMYITGGIAAIPEGGVLHGFTVEHILHSMNHICTTPPKFENAQLAGVPFYSLFIDFIDTEFGQGFLSSPITNAHLKNIFNDYQVMLLSKKSLEYITEDEKYGWLNSEADKRAEYKDFQLDRSKPHWGFSSWNDWFTRKLKEGARPIDTNPKAIVHSSDSYPLTYNANHIGSNPATNVEGGHQFWLKDNRYSLHDMLGSSKMGIRNLVNHHFVGGTVFQAFLDPWCYHRWHAPITGTVIKSYKLGGTYYIENPSIGRDPSNTKTTTYVDSQTMLSIVSVRQVFIIKPTDHPDRLVAVIEIGMLEVSGCNPTVIEGQHVEKGDQLGYFTFGGSSYAMILDKAFELTFDPKMFELNSKDDNGLASVCKAKVNSTLATFK